MRRWVFAAFAAFAWVLPALVAAALGWTGAGVAMPAFGDLLNPLRASGGAAHLPSFVVALALVKANPTFAPQAAAIARAVLMSAVVLGLLQLVDLQRLAQVLTTDVGGSAFRFERSYLGLCMASDALAALAWVLRRPLEKQGWVMTALVIAVPAALYAGSDAAGLGALKEPFQPGADAGSNDRDDGELWIYTRLQPDAAPFRERARDFVRDYRNDGDIAVYFTDSLQAANARGDGPVLATLCVYSDGTPDAWNKGRADCSDVRRNLLGRRDARVAELNASLPDDVSMYVAQSEICANADAQGDEQAHAIGGFCREQELDERRAELIDSYGEERLAAMLATLD